MKIMTERGQRIRHETDVKIKRAALDIALSMGTDAITIKEISRRSGVATTTIYRRYANTKDLLNNLFMPDVVESPSFGESTPSKASLRMLMAGLADYLEGTVGLKTVGAVMATDSVLFRSILSSIITPARHKVEEYLQRGVAEGIFRDGLNMEIVLDLIWGSTVAHALLHGDVTDKWTREITDCIWTAIAHV
ncbi:TetR/AcrR family transcriptional regulator [Bifidobacterium tibiigranuli]|uniref:TetR/AcrR family transcriptional regulator n=1 Tax=Bifidobacterium tibiigranuli TaxID=2172043 RepID=UPI0026F2D761|nr:TetR/AcrR family transcriptional regulator [Bifidobacterium tibiigranuli]MCI2186384.1 TetR/AcrR family transcriptional regulator [Bifidobacterium tibiigranuli]MCI2204432.1 TetR/AcrR family transcriptional regulator [Bifidobacterium tibiigranuli]